jgi:hypothetical protein
LSMFTESLSILTAWLITFAGIQNLLFNIKDALVRHLHSEFVYHIRSPFFFS